VVKKMMHHTKQTLSMQLIGCTFTSASQAGTGAGHLAGVASVLGDAHDLSDHEQRILF
jgi:hypothetical protein